MSCSLCISVQRCVACGKCELACAFAHGSEGLPGTARIHVFRRGPELGTPVTCLQCQDAACLATCPTGALVRDTYGTIRHREERCVRCGTCVAACPFGNMIQDSDRRVAKCDLCGGAPRCVPFCPTTALRFLPASAAIR